MWSKVDDSNGEQGDNVIINGSQPNEGAGEVTFENEKVLKS